MPDGILAVMGNLILLKLKEQKSEALLPISKQLAESIQGLVRLLQQLVPLLQRKIRRHAAYTLQDERLLAKLSAGDLVALEVSYHAHCVVFLYKKAKMVQEKDKEEEVQRPDGIVLAKLFSYIEERRASSDKKHPAVFKLSDLGNMYNTRIAQLLNETTPRSKYPTRLKERILTQLPGLQDYKKGQRLPSIR